MHRNGSEFQSFESATKITLKNSTWQGESQGTALTWINMTNVKQLMKLLIEIIKFSGLWESFESLVVE